MLPMRRNMSRALVAGAHKSSSVTAFPAARRTMAIPAWAEHPDRFERRHNGLKPEEEAEMLKVCGAASKAEMMDQVVPKQIRGRPDLIVGKDLTETEALEKLAGIVSKNKVYDSYIGMGYYNCITPPAILRNIIQNPGWYTPYTPYQAEISQGRMESLVNFQTLLTELTAMPIAQSSLLDESTAAAEAMAMCQTITKSKKPRFFISNECNPQTIDVCKVRADPMGIEIVIGDPFEAKLDKTYMGIMMPYPATDGIIKDYSKVIAHAKENAVNTCFIADLLSLTILKPPGELGVDIVVGNSQRLGVPLGYGGPHAGFMACKDEHKRAVPGRIIGKSIDAAGNMAYRLTLQAREQHIRREKANSNICTAQALLANTAAFYAVYHGPEGLRKIAERINGLAKGLQAGLKAQGYTVSDSPMFDTVKVSVDDAATLLKTGWEHKINLRQLDAKTITVSLDETTGIKELEVLLAVFGKHGKGKAPSAEALLASVTPGFDGVFKRTSTYLKQKVFNAYQTETELMRYMFHLQQKDMGLNTSMVPLGSCTMKLNAAAEMIPVTWPEINAIHPFVPLDQTTGYIEMIDELAKWLIDITGFDAMSMQPNAGASGEYAGLMCIREYHMARGDKHRNICLIPRAAHGTNPATAAMCGMEVTPIECDHEGNTDMADLADKIAKHKDNLGALMITYPSTHGVFEETIVDICKMVHDAGGLVYMDGANMNAQVGFTSPGHIGADVCHLNLHKTFCIPHGGGGPGMGPIGVVARLAPFLPGHSVIKTGGEKAMGAVAAAPWGSASILPISWMYIQMMGTKGLENATYQSILSANYIADRLKGDYKILFRGKQGRAAHEFILDLRPFKETCGVDGVDVAKRLMDYSLHAPTMSWPVAGTLMCEPTESESKAELDRFIEAMQSIREEIRMIAAGKLDKLDNPLKNAPHTKEELMGNEWKHSYSRELAAYPVPSLREKKFWPTVKRVDDVYGDKNVNVTHKE
eukprot:CAMPEP_0173377848 /NCGR_PEP_ID=MMETSP1356-20130122/1138_1 /TAXON_ID=77927 ORGANISM="Hemiselmis virescens, Strain PCC157" /NCGR_SAMPLE_ID=MMETSP1356 /ASSEMBLY_ACC=CAM_ASM_000847 /LENGTH=982 /DNA_ID=CAMNT_0014330749 /DNA_START=37 /DNA_END=2985 /DNA_ORIENTATION=-